MHDTHLLSHSMNCNSEMFGSWTFVHVEHKPYEKLTTVIKRIDGDGGEIRRMRYRRPGASHWKIYILSSHQNA